MKYFFHTFNMIIPRKNQDRKVHYKQQVSYEIQLFIRFKK